MNANILKKSILSLATCITMVTVGWTSFSNPADAATWSNSMENQQQFYHSRSNLNSFFPSFRWEQSEQANDSTSDSKENKVDASQVSTSSSVSEEIQAVIQAGKSYMGTPYEFGSDRSSTKTFDCSDFVQQVFEEGAGVSLPSNSRTQADYVKDNGSTTTNWENLETGDLMFFMSYKGSSASDYNGINKSTQRITHVGIYLGNGQILHTYSKDSGGVRIDSFEGTAWEYRFVFGGSAL